MTDKTKRILLVDDEESITGFVGYALRKEGFAVDIAANGTEAFEQSTKSPYDLYILDIMLPGIDGYELCRRIRDKVIGLEIGGDDYLTKPFGVRELLARIHALLRRSASSDQSPRNRFPFRESPSTKKRIWHPAPTAGFT